MIRLLIFIGIIGGISFLWNKTQLPGAVPLSKEELRQEIALAPNQPTPSVPDLATVFARAVAKLQEEKGAAISPPAQSNYTFNDDALSTLPHALAESLRADPDRAPQILQNAMDETSADQRRERLQIVEFARRIQTETKGVLSPVALRVLETPTSDHLALPDEEDLFRASCELARESILDVEKRASLMGQLLPLHPSTTAQELLKNSLSP